MAIYADRFENYVFSRVLRHDKVTYTPIVPLFLFLNVFINQTVLDKMNDICHV